MDNVQKRNICSNVQLSRNLDLSTELISEGQVQ
jgi:hypothetical protein